MSEFLSRLVAGALNRLQETPLERILTRLTGGRPGAAGLGALVERLRAGGLADRVESWIATGENRPVAPQELERALGPQETDRMAREAGLDRPGLLLLLSQVLPRLVDGLTPQGRLPSQEELQAGAGGGRLGELLPSILGRLAGAGAAGAGQGREGAILPGGTAAAVHGQESGTPDHAGGRGAGAEAGTPRPPEDAPRATRGTNPASGPEGQPPPSGPRRG